MRFYRSYGRSYRDVRFGDGKAQELSINLKELADRTNKGVSRLELAISNYHMARTYLQKGNYQQAAQHASLAARNINDAFQYIPQSDKDVSTWIRMLDK